MKWAKCSFMKLHIEYLGHLISENSIEPMPDKLSAIKEMPAPRSPKEIKQFLGLVGYYRKFIPRFSDIAKPLMRLTRHDTLFQWCTKCEFAFQSLKNALCTKPILKFPDLQKSYVLFTDASKYAWVSVLTQPCTKEAEGKVVTTHHPVTYVSRLFKGSQLNWAALTKEAYAIYMSIKKLSFYLTDVEITLGSDHLPLKKFLLKNTLNSKVNNWPVELETFNIKFEHISGIKNTLADTLSRIIKVDPDVQSECEKEGYEFSYSCFEKLPPAEVFEVEERIAKAMKLQPNMDIEIPEMECTLPVPTVKLHEFQLKDELYQKKSRQVNTNTDTSRLYYIDRDGVLRKILEDNEEVFQTTVLPRILINLVLQLAHNSAGHNGFQWVYLLIRRLYYWNNMKKDILHHCKQCAVCEKFKVERIKFEKLYFSIPNQPMEFICMDLIGEFYPPTSRCHRYALTVMDMLTGFVFCTPLKSKKAEEVIQTYLNEVYFRFGGSRKILSVNGMEFKNRMLEEVAKKLDCEFRAYSPPYRPQSNGKIECFHKFLKACMGKHINTHLEWDEVIPMAMAAYNFFPHTPVKKDCPSLCLEETH